MALDISLDDLLPFDDTISAVKADALITGAIARACLIAPCLVEDEFGDRWADAARSVLVQTILRWSQTKPGLTGETEGPFSASYGTARELFWPAELVELQDICGDYRHNLTGVDGAGSSDTSVPNWFFPPGEEPGMLPDWVNLLC